MKGNAARGLHISRTEHAGVTVIALDGELDLGTVDALSAQITAAYERGPDLVLDLTGLVFVDSTGLRVLVRAHRDSAERGGTLALAALRPQVARALEVSGLDGRIACHPTAERALSRHCGARDDAPPA